MAQTGLSELHLSVKTLCGTQKASVPHRPLLGVDWLATLDAPLVVAVPLIVSEVERNLRLYEKRVRLIRVPVVPLSSGQYKAQVYWVPVGFGAESVQLSEVTGVAA